MPVSVCITLVRSLLELNQTDNKRVAAFLEKFLENPQQPGTSLERVSQTKGKDIWSARISQDLRAILHKDGELWSVLYAAHHDQGYAWAENRRIEKHSVTGVLQITPISNLTDQDLDVSVNCTARRPSIFDRYSEEYLVSLGLPASWIPTIRSVDSEDQLLEIVSELPEDVADRLLELAAGRLVAPPAPSSGTAAASDDHRRSFFVVENGDELIRVLQAPLSEWIAFLHPTQHKLATGTFSGPVKITGSAGTGKTVVGMHRARHFAAQRQRVLFTSYVGTLCDNIRQNLRILCASEELSRITVDTVHAQAMAVLRDAGVVFTPVDDNEVYELITRFNKFKGPLDESTLRSEWHAIVQYHCIDSWDQYRSVSRKGRGTSLTIKERKLVWDVFHEVLNYMEEHRISDWSRMCSHARRLITDGRSNASYDVVIVDEVQDLRPQELMFLSSLSREKACLTLLGDGGQRIYGKKISLKSLGIDVRGRSHVLKINYRTTHQIRKFADSILDPSCDDLDEGIQDRSGTRSLLRGPAPQLSGFKDSSAQNDFIVKKITSLIQQGVRLGDIAIFARKADLLNAIETSLNENKIRNSRLKPEHKSSDSDESVKLGTMHRAKGLEFKIVFVADVSKNIVPLSTVAKGFTDPADQQDFVDKERQLLYVSVTRARDQIFLTWVGKPSEFLEGTFAMLQTAGIS